MLCPELRICLENIKKIDSKSSAGYRIVDVIIDKWYLRENSIKFYIIIRLSYIIIR